MLFLSVFVFLGLGLISADTDTTALYNSEFTMIHVKEITTSSITLHWITGDAELEGNVTSWKVKYHIGGEEHMSEDLPLSIKHFTISGLDVDTRYFVCVSLYMRAEYVQQMEGADDEGHLVCDDVRTIPYMRRDSIISMTVILVAFTIIILSAVLTWRRARLNFMKCSRSGVNGYDDGVELTSIDQREPLKTRCSIEERT